MNELEIIRSQLAIEQAHASEVANACAEAFGSADAAHSSPEGNSPFRDACVSYLVWVLARFEERDQTLSELLASRESRVVAGEAAVGAREITGLVGRSGTSREALARLESALAADGAAAAGAAWREFARFFNSAWAPRRGALEDVLVRQLSVTDWRAVSAIDADSILEERKRYARLAAELPAGIGLRRTAPLERR